MTQTHKPDLVLSAAGHDDTTRTWVLDPQGRDSFRIVVRCRRAQPAPTPPKPHSWFGYCAALVQPLLPVLAFWRAAQGCGQ
jgi:hypothetical protein